MTQGKTDGKRRKFRILCRRCNSYLHTRCAIDDAGITIWCQKCDNTASSFAEEFEE